MATERAMLGEILEDDRLTEAEREAFSDMADRLRASPSRCLSEKQKDWVERRYEELGLGAGTSKNLVSSGKVPRPRSTAPVLPWEKPGYVKAAKPPGKG